MSKILVVAPHPDDETLGCGGTLLRHRHDGDEVHWLIMTSMAERFGYAAERIAARAGEIQAVAQRYAFSSITCLDYGPARLDQTSQAELIAQVGQAVFAIAPATIYLPYRGDIHTDHAICFDAVAACTKSFRYPSVRQVLAYETLSETDFALNPDTGGFRPNVFVDITEFLDAKIAIAKLYAGEIGEFPFPRSEQAIRALAIVRGAVAGCSAAESFMLLKDIRR